MILCIAEKPSVARDIARILGAASQKEGYFEGNGYWVSWALGHLCTLMEPSDYTDKWKKWSMSVLPMVPDKYQIKASENPMSKKQLKVLAGLLKKCTGVINCGDAGQEGELIQRWILQICGYKGPVRRLWISSLTDEAIRVGFENLKPAADYDKLYLAAMCRACGDWLLGLNATRLYTIRYGGYNTMLSVGRVQTPTLAMIVARDKEIANFRPQDYYMLCTDYRGVRFWLDADPKRFAIESQAVALRNRAGDHTFVVDSFVTKKESEAPQQLFDLTALQIECNRCFGFSADTTLKIAQALYEKKITTYPRTDSRYLTMDMYPKCKYILEKISSVFGDKWKQVETELGKRASGPLKRSKTFDDSKVSDHHAIIPTGQSGSMTAEESKVYDLICRRFAMQFFPDAVYDRAVACGHAGDVKFKASGKVLIDAGWRYLLASAEQPQSENNDNDEDKEQGMPAFRIGESGSHSPSVIKKTTKPPKPYTEGTLLKAMETCGKMVESEELAEALKANGIGRPSTRAAIIETLLKRGYLTKCRSALTSTPAGQKLIGVIKDEALTSPVLTGTWERRLRDIEKGVYSAATFMVEIRNLVENLILTAKTDANADANKIQTGKYSNNSKSKKAYKPYSQYNRKGYAKMVSGTSRKAN